MKRIATLPALRTSSNAILRVGAFWVRGSAMVTTTAVTEVTKIQPFATRGRATPKPSLPARTDAAFRSRGIAMPTMTAVMDRTNRHTSAASGIVPPDGDVVPNGATIAAFRSGSSATGRTIVVMVISSISFKLLNE